ncbi:MAG: ATP-dependent DNA helicase RecG [Pseudomonadota bacterium]
MLSAASPVTAVKGVGPQMAEKLARLHIESLQDVLFHLPLRYEDRTHVTDIDSLTPGQSAVVIARVRHAKVVFGRRRSLMVTLEGEAGYLGLRFFYFNRNQEKSFKPGAWVRCYGEVRGGFNGLEMIHPEYRISQTQPEGGFETSLRAVYPTTEGITQLFWHKLTDQVISLLLTDLKQLLPIDVLPKSLRSDAEHHSLADSLRYLHRPPPGTDLANLQDATTGAHRLLIFEELLAHHFRFRKARLQRQQERAIALAGSSELQNRFESVLPFTLTQAQSRVVAETLTDLADTQPSMRLIQGDVGAGKTVVAASAILAAVVNDKQAVLMAPTELLAEQHLTTLSSYFTPLDIEVGFLASKVSEAKKRTLKAKLADGSLKVVVGTHALIQDTVHFQNLCLIIIDEQHRFGVAQRLALRDKGQTNSVPHQLAMTATPIPRTLAMTFYADLDVSSIDELPPGRKPIETVVMPIEAKRDAVVERVKQACAQGKQAYWVCPIIEESETLDVQAAIDVSEELAKRLVPQRVGLVHGRLKSAEKEAVMTAFRDGELDVLVATTVIEVGVDVPNASLMIVENAERLGLAQLHQLRGRVGRGDKQSYCILLYKAPLSQHGRERLDILRRTNDGFVIAEKDLEIRGAGEFLGTRQTGSVSFRVANLLRDQNLLPLVEQSAQSLMATKPDHVDLLIERWIGTRESYVNA